jgi:hypothetical protein
MSPVKVKVLRLSTNENLGEFYINTYMVDKDGNTVGRTDPKASHSRVTWAPTDKSTHSHPPVFSDIRTQNLNFPTESAARAACKQAIKAYFDARNPQDIDVT